MAALPQQPPPPIGPVFAELSSAVLPEDLALETFNSQYLQRHSSSPLSILAAAKVSQQLQAPREEVENTLLTALGESVELDIKVRDGAIGAHHTD